MKRVLYPNSVLAQITTEQVELGVRQGSGFGANASRSMGMRRTSPRNATGAAPWICSGKMDAEIWAMVDEIANVCPIPQAGKTAPGEDPPAAGPVWDRQKAPLRGDHPRCGRDQAASRWVPGSRLGVGSVDVAACGCGVNSPVRNRPIVSALVAAITAGGTQA